MKMLDFDNQELLRQQNRNLMQTVRDLYIMINSASAPVENQQPESEELLLLRYQVISQQQQIYQLKQVYQIVSQHNYQLYDRLAEENQGTRLENQRYAFWLREKMLSQEIQRITAQYNALLAKYQSKCLVSDELLYYIADGYHIISAFKEDDLGACKESPGSNKHILQESEGNSEPHELPRGSATLAEHLKPSKHSLEERFEYEEAESAEMEPAQEQLQPAAADGQYRYIQAEMQGAEAGQREKSPDALPPREAPAIAERSYSGDNADDAMFLENKYENEELF